MTNAMTLTELDTTLARLRMSAERIGTNLVELDRDPNRALLEHAALEGLTADRWAEAAGLTGALWSDLTKLNCLLDEAAALRGTKVRLSPAKENALREMLTGPAIELERTDVPIHARGLLSSKQTSDRCTADELVAQMAESFKQVQQLLVEVSVAWDDFVMRISTARAALDQKIAEATNVDEQIRVELEQLTSRFDALGQALLSDPLSVRADDVTALEDELTALGDALFASTDLRAAIGDRIEHAHAQLAEIRAAAESAAKAHDLVRAKIRGAASKPPEVDDRALERQLADVAALVREARWRDADTQLARWTERTEQLEAALAQSTAENLERIAARDELRGLLRAYEAMMHARGRAEDSDVAARYERSRTVLYTAPTDLVQAAALVDEYERAITADRRLAE
jgi:hypothetical protein